MMPTTTAETKVETQPHDELLESLSASKRLIAKQKKRSAEEPPADNGDEPSSSKETPPADNGDEPSSKKKTKIEEPGVGTIGNNVPSLGIVGVNNKKLLHLCATVSGEIYDEKAINGPAFEEILKNIPQVAKEFPDLQVRFIQTGPKFGDIVPAKMSTNPPSFAGIITGDTLILAWRGTQTIPDMLADIRFSPTTPSGWDEACPGLQVQEVYYNMIKTYFRSHEQDVLNYVSGNYMKDKNKPLSNEPDKRGTPIKRIILTGHSLGGGLAQVAHLYLSVLGGKDNAKVGHLGSKKGLDVRTLAFSAPMTTAFTSTTDTTMLKFLNDTVTPKMRNFVYSRDVVPRAYANLRFIDDMVDAFLDDTSSASEAELGFAEVFVDWIKKHGDDKNWQDVLTKYCHIGKLIHYGNMKAAPETYVDEGFSERGPLKTSRRELSFYDLTYDGPDTDVAKTAMANHMALVTGPGLSYAKK
jgi:hypothetical protein